VWAPSKPETEGGAKGRGQERRVVSGIKGSTGGKEHGKGIHGPQKNESRDKKRKRGQEKESLPKLRQRNFIKRAKKEGLAWGTKPDKKLPERNSL